MSKHQNLRVFISYAHRDEAIRQTLETHLAPLVREQIISLWHDRSIGPGMDWEQELDRSIEQADLILLLVSPAFFDSDYCFGKEMEFALAQHNKGLARVIPILVRDTYLERSRISELQFLPRDGRSIADFENIDLAWKAIVSEIDKVARDWELHRKHGTLSSTENEANTVPDSNEWNGFAIFLQAELRKIDAVEHWEDRRFTDLDVEVEAEGRHSGKWIPSVFKNEQRSLRRESSLIEAMENANERLILLEGEPGSGKSVGLRHLARVLLDRTVTKENTDSVLPLYVNLKAFKPVPGEEVDHTTVRNFILRTIEGSCDWSVRQFIETYFEWGLNQSRWLLLLDSFDEIPDVLSSGEPDETVKRYADAIHAFAYGLHSKCRVILASRPYRGPKRMGWPRFRVLPLGEIRRNELIARWFEDRQVIQSISSELGAASDQLGDSIKNPLFLSLVCAYRQAEGTLPKSTHEAYEGFITRRLTRDERRLKALEMTQQDIRDGAEQIAYAMTACSELGMSPTRESIRVALENEQLPCIGRAEEILDALEGLRLGRGPIEKRGDRTFAFLHRRIQEYFATTFVLKNPRRIDSHRLLTDGRWRETAVTILQTSKPADLFPLISEAKKLIEKWVTDLKHQDTNLQDFFEGRQYQSPPIPFPWPPGSLHLLEILQSGCSSATLDTQTTPLQNQADLMITAAYNLGIRLDKHFALEVAGAASAGTLETLLTAGFTEGSVWLKDTCYRQAARLRKVPDKISEGMRLSLIKQWSQNRLTSDRSMTEAHLQRVDPSLGLLDCFRLLLSIRRIDGILLISCLLLPILLLSSPLLGLSPASNYDMHIPIAALLFTQFVTTRWPKWFYRYRKVNPYVTENRGIRGKDYTPGFIFGLRLCVVSIIIAYTVKETEGFMETNQFGDTYIPWFVGLIVAYYLVGIYWSTWATAAISAVRSGHLIKRKWWPLIPILLPIRRMSQVRMSAVKLNLKKVERIYLFLAGLVVSLVVLIYILRYELMTIMDFLDDVKIVGGISVGHVLLATSIIFMLAIPLIPMLGDQRRLMTMRKPQAALGAMDLLEGCFNLQDTKSRIRYIRWIRENNRLEATPEAVQILLDLTSAIERDDSLFGQPDWFPLLADERWSLPFKQWYRRKVPTLGLFDWYSDGLIDELSQLIIQARSHLGITVDRKVQTK